ncbi:hypothetical protein TcasGA2_TC031731 [Tribolium castaneum]|uniref:Uncharacterized protein n=1 Tax=Tribolium castaneum TaxID=7070 RepID=A0A139W9I6_TRICA|nr:hypothetical protein TcasGA2_TC031731 [Tribolium castaneum]
MCLLKFHIIYVFKIYTREMVNRCYGVLLLIGDLCVFKCC